MDADKTGSIAGIDCKAPGRDYTPRIAEWRDARCNWKPCLIVNDGVVENEPTGLQLKSRRMRLGLSQTSLAQRLGVTANTLARWERGEQRISNPERIRALLRKVERATSASGTRKLAAPTGVQSQLGRRRSFPNSDNLPSPLSSLVGRLSEQAEVRRLVLAARLVTLSGVGGIGKTRLALHVAAELRKDFSAGVWLAELAPIVDPTLVPQVVAATLEVAEKRGQPLTETLAEAVRGRALLLVLDNCEHLIESAAKLAENLLRAGNSIRILATSREPLGVDGETVWQVPAMTLPTLEFGHPPKASEVAESEAVRLFVERATAVDPTFALNDDSAPAVLEVCRKLDGIPLAIELAAASMTFLSVHQLSVQLLESPRFSVTPRRSTPARHRTMTAAIEWSIHLLSTCERQLFARLSVFAVGFDIDAAKSICAGDEVAADSVVTLLGRLVSKSLVATDRRPHEPVRYRVLEPLRDFGIEMLRNAGELETVRQRHASFYLELANRADQIRSAGSVASFERIVAPECDNLHAAFAWLSAHERAGGAQMVGVAVSHAWRVRGQVGEARMLLQRLRQIGLPDDMTIGRANVSLVAGQLAHIQGDLAAAGALLRESVKLSEALGENCGIFRGATRLSDVAKMQGQFDEARALLEEALRASEAVPDRGLKGVVLAKAAQLERELGNFEQANALALEALPLLRQAGWTRVLANTLLLLGDAAAQRHDVAQATSLLTDGIATWYSLPSATEDADLGRALLEAARVALDTSGDIMAASFLREGLSISKAIDDLWGATQGLEIAAAIAASRGYPDQAVSLLEVVTGLAERMRFFRSPRVKVWQAHRLRRAEQQLDAARLTAAREVGRTLTLDAAIELALACADGDQTRGRQSNSQARSDAITSALEANRSASSGAPLQAFDRLSSREREVVALVCRGMTDREIANELSISEHTVHHHVRNILGKLTLQRRGQLGAHMLGLSHP